MWVNLVTCLWILFDVLICLRTGYMTGPFSRGEWWGWLLGGGALAVFAFVAQYLESKATNKGMTDLKEQLIELKGIHQGGLSTLGQLSSKILEKLAEEAEESDAPNVRQEVAELKAALRAQSMGERKQGVDCYWCENEIPHIHVLGSKGATSWGS